MLLVLLVLPFLGSALAAFLPSHARRTPALLAAVVSLAGVVISGSQYRAVGAGHAVRVVLEWMPEFGLNLSLRMDGFAWLFCLLVTGIGFLVVLYARYYMAPEDPVHRFFSLFLAFMGAMLGVVLSGNLVQLVFFWELTSIFSFLLIGYWHQNRAARDGARMALVVTSAGGLCLLVGVLLIGEIVGSYDLEVVVASAEQLRAHSMYVPALALIATGALTKSAQFPFHFWLPHAMAAPTPVSAYLHSAAMVKLGVFLLARLWPAMAGTDAWIWIVGLAGLLTLVLGAYVAIFQHDLKGLLAYSTISHLGLITVLLGLNSELALIAAVFHILNHATFKASLFMAAGIVDHETGTRDMRRLSGLARFMPITATLAMVAAAAMAGVPLLNGFLSKEMFFSESLEVEGPSRTLNYLLPFIATAWGAFSVAYSLRFIHAVFFGPAPGPLPRTPHEPPRWMRFPIEFLALACLLVGILPAVMVGPLLDIAMPALLGSRSPEYSLAVWHGFTTPMLMSLLALGGGAILYRLLTPYLSRGEERTPLLSPLDGRRIFNGLLTALSLVWSRGFERTFGTQRLQPQLGLLLVVTLATGLWPVYERGLHIGPLALTPLDAGFGFMWFVGCTCAVAAAWQAKFHRLSALLLASGAGLVVSLTFVKLSAPDLALTQILVEIVTTVLLLLGLRWLPKRIPFKWTLTGAKRAFPRRFRDLTIAVAVGAGLGLVAYAVMTRPLPDNVISRFFLERAWPEGGGSNVVNVIIVDFRAFDTLGEISVLAVVGLTVFALLRRFRPAPESVGTLLQHAQQTRAQVSEDMVVPKVLMRWMFPAIATLAIYLLMRGHNLPGGGFVAGITLSIGVILQYMAGGTRWTEDHLAIHPLIWMGGGVLIAVITGAGAWLFGYPFLTSHVAHLTLPVIGALHVPSAFFFDVGVFCLVVGATGLILIALAHQSTRGHDRAKGG